MRLKAQLLPLGLLAGLGSVANAATFNCISSKSCSQTGECEVSINEFQVYERLAGQGRLDLAGSLVDMDELLQDKSDRRDWLINGALTGYTGLVSIYEDGSFVLSEHSQSKGGAPIYAVLFGSCEVKE